jgi:hypothetical protein
MDRDELVREYREVGKDLLAFKQARDCLHSRLREIEQPERQSLLRDWPAFCVVDNGLILAIVRCEGLLEDYGRLLDQRSDDNVIRLERKK